MDTADLIATLRDTANNIHSRGPILAAMHLNMAADEIERLHTDKRREFFRALDEAETQRALMKATSVGHDIGTGAWHREQALHADRHRPRRDDIGGRIFIGSRYNAESVPGITCHAVDPQMTQDEAESIAYKAADEFIVAANRSGAHIPLNHEGLNAIKLAAQQALDRREPGQWVVDAALPDSDWLRTPAVTVQLKV